MHSGGLTVACYVYAANIPLLMTSNVAAITSQYLSS